MNSWHRQMIHQSEEDTEETRRWLNQANGRADQAEDAEKDKDNEEQTGAKDSPAAC